MLSNRSVISIFKTFQPAVLCGPSRQDALCYLPCNHELVNAAEGHLWSGGFWGSGLRADRARFWLSLNQLHLILCFSFFVIISYLFVLFFLFLWAVWRFYECSF